MKVFKNIYIMRKAVARLLLIILLGFFICVITLAVKTNKNNRAQVVDQVEGCYKTEEPKIEKETLVSTDDCLHTEAQIEELTEVLDADTETAPQLNNTPILFTTVVYTELFNIDKSTELLEQITSYIDEIDVALNSAEYTEEALGYMQQEYVRLSDILSKYKADIAKYSQWEIEYYYAAKVWEFFRSRGYNEQVTSAIIGNMMIECGGGTLKLKPEIYSADGGFYGLCQWSLYYKPFMSGKSFEDQLTYLVDDLPKEFKNFGFCYTKGYTYDHFLASEDPAQAALAFAKVYERCAANSYNMRKLAAVKAYQYFVLDHSNSF